MLFNRPVKNKPLLFLHLPFDCSRKSQYQLNNCKLHDAIISNNNKEAAQLIEEDKKYDLVNRQSLLNTPLMLALKHGNIEIAKLILTKIPKEELDVSQEDCRSLTALDIACMLRQDEIIKIILHSPYVDLREDSLAMILYRDSVDKDKFKSYLQKINPENVAGMMTESSVPCPAINLHEPYTDLMIFYLQNICCNFGWMRSDQFAQQNGASYAWFYRCFKVGYETFCEKRNAIPVDQELLKALQNQENLNEWKKKQKVASEHKGYRR